MGSGAVGVALAALVLVCAPATALAHPKLIAPAAVMSGRAVHSSGVSGGSLRGERVTPLRVLNRPAYERAKYAAAVRTGQAATAPAGGGAPSMAAVASANAIQGAVFGSLNQSGLSAAAEIAELGLDVTPPDSTGAIGPNDYVEIVNSEIAAYSRSALALVAGSPVSLDQFSGGVETCDPQIKYDPQSGRWFYLAIRCDLVEERLYVGFSKSSDPTDLSTASGGGWCGYEYNTGEVFEDYPKLGLDPQHILIGANSYEAKEPGAFLTAHIISAPKPSAGTITSCPETPSLTVFGSTAKPLMTSLGHYAFTPEPATVADTSTAGYVVAADFNNEFTGGENIMIWEVGGTAAEPHLEELGAVAVSSYEIPPPVPQPRNNRPLDSLDARLTQAVAATDPNAGEEAVWTQHTVAGGAGSMVRWYELLPGQLGKGAAVRQEGTISDPSKYVFNAAIAPTLNGGAAINYNTGSASAEVQIAAQTRNGSDPLGTMGAPVGLGSSAAPDSDFTCHEKLGGEICRWGDYAGASVDPGNENVVWGSNQLSGPSEGNNAQWMTRNFALIVRKTQTITFTSTAPSSASVGGPAYTVSASASSGLPVTFSSATPAVCSVSGSLVSFIGTGECVIDADQAGNSEYEPAPTQQQKIAVAKGSQTITFTSTAPAGATVGGPTYNASATGGGSGNPVTFTIDSASTSVCSISGATVSFIGGGTCTIDANQAGNANYEAAPQAQQSFAVARRSQTITFTSTAPSSASVGGPAYTVSASASSGLPVTLSSASPAVCSVSGSLVSFIAAGECVIAADQAGDSEYEPAPTQQQKIAVAAAPGGATPGPSSPGSTGAAPSTSPLTAPLAPLLAPDSNFKLLQVKINRRTGAITFSLSVQNPGTLSWLLTFQNGRFGVFSARAAKCPTGSLRLRGRCRPSRITYALGSTRVAQPGVVTFTVKPTPAGLTALRHAGRRRKAVPIAARLSFQSSLGGAAVSHTRPLAVRLRRRR